jgi:uncharacterized membrane protein YkvA (DUF1232 family)
MVVRSEQALAASAAEFARNSGVVARDFWRKLSRLATQLPFAEDLAAAWFCATDPATPAKAKGILVAALAYFVLPFDAIPDFLAGIGFTDDAAVLALAIRTVSKHMKPEHYDRARAALGRSQTKSVEKVA